MIGVEVFADGDRSKRSSRQEAGVSMKGASVGTRRITTGGSRSSTNDFFDRLPCPAPEGQR
jgi:hypothetical protein